RKTNNKKIHNFRTGIQTLKIDIYTAKAIPIHKLTNITFFFIRPAVTSSTCSVNTYTAGSANTTTVPNMKPITGNNQDDSKLAIPSPINLPTSMNPAFTPTINSVSPRYV